MKTNQIKNLSFGALKFDFKGAPPSKRQMKIINNIIENPNLNCKLIKDLENNNTDIYISTRKGSEEIALRLYTDLDWFDKKMIPFGKYNTKMETFINPDFDDKNTMNLRISNFFFRAKGVDISSEKNLDLAQQIIYG